MSIPITLFAMPKIAYLSGTTILGGGPEHLFQILKNLDGQRWTPLVCTWNDGPYWGRFQSLGIPLFPFTLRKLSPGTFVKLYHLLKHQRPDLIHTHGKGPGLYGRIIGRILGIPVIHTFHGFHYEDIPAWKRWFHLGVEQILTRFTAQHIFVGPGEKKRARILSGLNEKNSTLIPNGIDTDSIQNLKVDKADLLGRVGLSPVADMKIVGTLSRLSPEKGIDLLVEGFSLAAARHPGIKLLIVGGSPPEHRSYFERVGAQTQNIGIKDRVVILGYREDALQFLKCMDVFVLPSLSEGLPLTLLEALASGIPAVASDIAGNRDAVGSSDCARLYSPRSPSEMAEAILETLALDAESKTARIQKGLKRIRDGFTAAQMVQSTFRLYEKTWASNKPRRLPPSSHR